MAGTRKGGWRSWAPGLVLAAGMALAVFVINAPDPRHNHLKGGESDLGYYVQHDGNVLPGDPSTPVQAGDAIQFTYRTTATRMILLSVDAGGTVTVFWPAHANGTDHGVDVIPGERHVLDGSIVLDDAPSPEVFVGFFGDWTVDEAKTRAEVTFASAGIDGIASWGRSPDVRDEGGTEPGNAVATVVIEKAE